MKKRINREKVKRQERFIKAVERAVSRAAALGYKKPYDLGLFILTEMEYSGLELKNAPRETEAGAIVFDETTGRYLTIPND